MEKVAAEEDTTAIVEDPLAEIRAQRAEKFKDEEDKVVGSIKFFTSEKEWNKNADARYFEFKNDDPNISSTCRIGNYGFVTEYPSFYNDSLYKVHIRGDITGYDYYKHEIPANYKVALDLYTQKYGEPDEKFELPAAHETSNNSLIRLASWQIGPKSIWIDLNSDDYKYSIDIIITRTDIADRVKREQAKKERNNTTADADKI